MQYSLGDCSVDIGFRFYEKLHEPIFLISKLGRIIKINEAGRKLIKVAHLSPTEIECMLARNLNELSVFTLKNTVVKTKFRKLHLVISKFLGSEYYLVEVKSGR